MCLSKSVKLNITQNQTIYKGVYCFYEKTESINGIVAIESAVERLTIPCCSPLLPISLTSFVTICSLINNSLKMFLHLFMNKLYEYSSRF